MNDRIRELAEQQAGSILMDLIMPDAGMPKRVEWNIGCTTEHLVKFAELIVKECGVALNPMLRNMVSRGQAYDLIKQHFGVEE